MSQTTQTLLRHGTILPLLAPLTSLAGECSQIKSAKAKGTKKVPWHWDKVNQRAFNHAQATIAKDVVLAYPD
jgi:hypothetical protein